MAEPKPNPTPDEGQTSEAETPTATSFAFADIPDEDITATSKNPDAERMTEFDAIVRNLEPGKAKGFPVKAGDSARGAVLLFSRAATRVYGKEQKVIECGSYTKDGVVWAFARKAAAKPEAGKAN